MVFSDAPAASTVESDRVTHTPWKRFAMKIAVRVPSSKRCATILLMMCYKATTAQAVSLEVSREAWRRSQFLAEKEPCGRW